MIQLFIIFHKNIFDDCYKNIPHDILTKYFTFIAVNENIPKIYTPNKYKIINEWELPIYDKTFQERGYNENSTLYHLYVNKLYKDYEYIGFFQYDMEFPENIIAYMDKHMSQSNCYALQLENFNFCCYRTWNEPKTLEYVINDYEKFFNTTFSKDYQYPLCNSYVISIDKYEKIMNWVVQLYAKLYPWCIQPPNANGIGHIGGIYERVMALAIGQEKLEYITATIKHDHKYKRKI